MEKSNQELIVCIAHTLEEVSFEYETIRKLVLDYDRLTKHLKVGEAK